jgi:hypothetical protein
VQHAQVQVGGDPADLDGPELTALPTRSGVLRMLRRIDDARGRVEREWERLSGEQSHAQLPGEQSHRPAKRCRSWRGAKRGGCGFFCPAWLGFAMGW